MMDWTPATKEEVLEAIAETVADAGPAVWRPHSQHLVDPYPALIDRWGSVEKVWVVARFAHRVIFYDDIEDSFATATEKEGRLTDCADYGDLRVAMTQALQEAARKH